MPRCGAFRNYFEECDIFAQTLATNSIFHYPLRPGHSFSGSLNSRISNLLTSKDNIENQIELTVNQWSLELENLLDELKTPVILASRTIEERVNVDGWLNSPELEDYYAGNLSYRFISIAQNSPAAERLYFYFNSPLIQKNN